LTQERERYSRERKEDNAPDADRQGNKQESAENVSAMADEVLADIDQALQEALGVGEDENLDADELTDLADRWVKSYVQKGGQ
jgi:type IV secretory pathway VirB4 component